jgi:ATP-binding cassette subfamily B protein RaxB
MILQYHGIESSLEGLCRIMRPKLPNGTTALAISRAAKRLRLPCFGLELTADEIQPWMLPAIAHWQQRHFVVLERLTSRKAFIVDPAGGAMVLSRKDFAVAFCRALLVFQSSKAHLL